MKLFYLSFDNKDKIFSSITALTAYKYENR